jgi:hypothetical protein
MNFFRLLLNLAFSKDDVLMIAEGGIECDWPVYFRGVQLKALSLRPAKVKANSKFATFHKALYDHRYFFYIAREVELVEAVQAKRSLANRPYIC